MLGLQITRCQFYLTKTFVKTIFEIFYKVNLLFELKLLQQCFAVRKKHNFNVFVLTPPMKKVFFLNSKVFYLKTLLNVFNKTKKLKNRMHLKNIF